MPSPPQDPPTPGQGQEGHLQTSYELPLPMRTANRPASPSPPAASSSRPASRSSQRSHKSQHSEKSSDSQAEKASEPEVHIPKIEPISPSKPSPADLVQGLGGKFVDEFGNILDWDGSVLGRVEGDLPSMVGRPISDNGEVRDTDGDVVGHVSHNYTLPTLAPLGNGLQVDEEGNIYDSEGNKVGKINAEALGGGSQKGDEDKKPKTLPDVKGTSGWQEHDCNVPRPNAAPRPDEIYLDVKSTHDGIQMIIKIPTVFNRNIVVNTTDNNG